MKMTPNIPPETLSMDELSRKIRDIKELLCNYHMWERYLEDSEELKTKLKNHSLIYQEAYKKKFEEYLDRYQQNEKGGLNDRIIKRDD
jgi:hypothetical protein